MTGTLPTWLERWLGLSTGPGEGTAWRLEHNWPWPAWVTLLLAIAAAAVVLSVYAREGRQTGLAYRLALAAVRLALVAIVAGMIAQVAISFQRTGLPYVAVLVDDSVSMTTVDQYEPKILAALRQRLDRAVSPGSRPSRWNLARTLLTENHGELLSTMAENYKLRFYYLAAKPQAETDVAGMVEEIKSLQPAADSTRLGAAVRNILDDLRGATPAAIVLLTDGLNTQGPSLEDAAKYARRKGVPLMVVGLGSDRPVRGLWLSDLSVDNVVFLNDVVTFRFKLTGNGLQGAKVPIVLRQVAIAAKENDGRGKPTADSKPTVVARTEATVGPDGQAQEIRLPYRPTVEGRFRYTIDIDPPPPGLQSKGPPLEREVLVRKAKIRVLLVQAYPSFEFRYLSNMLARDDTIELSTVLQEADVEYAEQEKKTALKVFPVEREKLFQYDVIVLGDVNPALLSPANLQNLADFVDQPGKGGSLVLLAGPRYMPRAFRDTPLARVMPFDIGTVRYPDPGKPLTEGFVARPTDLGLASPAMQLGDTLEETRAIWENLPPLYWMVEVPQLKPGVRVLAEHPTRLAPDGQKLPLIVMQYMRAGKEVLFHATDETWRWRRRMGDVYLARYWVQTLRYLCRAKLSEGGRGATLSTDRADGKYALGDAVRLEVRFTDESLVPAEDNGVRVELESQGRKKQPVQLQRSAGRRAVFEAVVSGLPTGNYRATVAVPVLREVPAASFQVEPPPGERTDLPIAAKEMRRAAEITKGKYYTFAEADQLVGDLPEGRQVPIEPLRPVTVWNRWPVLAVFFVLLIGEWLLRKRGGMV